MDDVELARRLRRSLADQERELRSSLILNPVENVPFAEDLLPVSGPLHGLYSTDKVRDREQRLATDMQFSGRAAMEADSRAVYDAWARALGAADVTLRVLSGLHAHITLFMGLARPGETILLLPVTAGGHVSGRAIVERLGLEVIEMVVDDAGQRIDMARTIERCEARRPDYVFVDRSEGLSVEDFSPLAAVEGPLAIFDASQYLTNIICGDHPNPFVAGFDLLVASIHKNFPGPQKALLATAELGDRWTDALRGASAYVSNMHTTSTYAAGLTLARRDWLAGYSRRMLDCAVALEDELAQRGVPVVRRDPERLPTHHVWIAEGSRPAAYATYERLESCRILTNFRLLPYGLGHGVRIGLSAVARLGLGASDMPRLAEVMAAVRQHGPSPARLEEVRSLAEQAWAGEGTMWL